VEKVRGGYAYQNPGEKSCHTRRENETDRKRRGAPGRHAIWARNQMTDSALESTSAWLLFDFDRPGTADVAHKRSAQYAGDSVLGDDAAQFVRGYSKECQIKQTKFSGQAVVLNSNPLSGRSRWSEKSRVVSRIPRAIVLRTPPFPQSWRRTPRSKSSLQFREAVFVP
jgi:hypothetical protein